jgi:uncharacterized metal-binding protein YceD (DUF177 family)
MTELPHHGFRRLITVAKIGDAGLAQTIEAKPPECDKIARYLDLLAVQSLTAEVALSHWRGKGVRVTGVLKADVTQACVVTLDPVVAQVEAEFERRYLPEEKLAREKAGAHEVFVDPEGEDPAEPLGREIDLGEILIEELSLNLEPYPRKAGVAFHADGAPPRENPFAALAKLKPKLLKKDG